LSPSNRLNKQLLLLLPHLQGVTKVVAKVKEAKGVKEGL